MNLCIFSGRMTDNPSMSTRTWTKADGTAATGNVVNFTLACRQPGSDQALFVRVAAWNGLAKLVNEYGFKGKEMTVTGPARVETYIRSNGQPGVALGIRAESIEFHGPAKAEAQDAPAELVDPETGEIVTAPAGQAAADTPF